ncbi:MAG: hypothetical protein J3R72DRAFT_197288 [Linnemannia gamsii]|nr:MAG: hypothetical protein J3R72DRAFT_197288 [Linnemannia gamsii]
MLNQQEQQQQQQQQQHLKSQQCESNQPTPNRISRQYRPHPLHHYQQPQLLPQPHQWHSNQFQQLSPFLHRKHRSFSGTTSPSSATLTSMPEIKSGLLGKKRPSGEDLHELYYFSSRISSAPTTDALPPAPQPLITFNASGSISDNSRDPTMFLPMLGAFRSNPSSGKTALGRRSSGEGGQRFINNIGPLPSSPSPVLMSSKRSRSLCSPADVALLLEVHSAANQGRLLSGVFRYTPASRQTHFFLRIIEERI